MCDDCKLVGELTVNEVLLELTIRTSSGAVSCYDGQRTAVRYSVMRESVESSLVLTNDH